MAHPNDAERTGVKNHSKFHPAEGNLRHHKPEPSGAIAQGTDAYFVGNDDNLEKLTTDNLRGRARSLAIRGWETADRDELLASLKAYQEEVLDPRSTYQ